MSETAEERTKTPRANFMNLKKLILTAGIFFLGTALSCNNDDEAEDLSCIGLSPSFTEVNQIFQRSCQDADCHHANSFNGPGALITYQQIFAARNGIKTAVASGRMPEGTTLSAGEKRAIICWIESGAPNN